MTVVYSTISQCVVAAWTVSIGNSNVRLRSHIKCPAGEICTSWQTWSEYLNITSIPVQSLLQSLIYIALAVCLLSEPCLHQSLTFCTGRLQRKCGYSCEDIRPIVSVLSCAHCHIPSTCFPLVRFTQEVRSIPIISSRLS